MNTLHRQSNKRGLLAAIAVAIPATSIGSGLCTPTPAQAAYIVTLEEVGANVVATGSGSLNLAALTEDGTSATTPAVDPSDALLVTGAAAASDNIFEGITGPTSFGPGGNTDATSSSGDSILILNGTSGTAGIDVPTDYVFGSPLASSAIFDNATFASLGATPGTYEWTWGSGENADSYTLVIGAVPAPLIGRGLPVLLAVGGLLFGAKLLERSKRRGLQSG